MEEETFPYRGLESENNDEIEEERRLAYVAITRARRRLYISHVTTRTIFGQTRYLAPSRFLLQLPEEVVEQRGLPSWAGRVHAAAARGRQAEFGDQHPEESWDQRTPEQKPPTPARFAPDRSTRAREIARPRPAPPTRDRVVDYSAFSDVSGGCVAVDDGSALGSSGGALALRRGMRVFHRRFGNGIVEQCEGSDKVVARFKGFGPKKVLLEYLTLQK
jgi:DNA helicase-2/ATP-dependent DNA helicase PcrA